MKVVLSNDWFYNIDNDLANFLRNRKGQKESFFVKLVTLNKKKLAICSFQSLYTKYLQNVIPIYTSTPLAQPILIIFYYSFSMNNCL